MFCFGIVYNFFPANFPYKNPEAIKIGKLVYSADNLRYIAPAEAIVQIYTDQYGFDLNGLFLNDYVSMPKPEDFKILKLLTIQTPVIYYITCY